MAAHPAAIAQQGRKVATLEQRLAAIRWAHELAGRPTPTAHAGSGLL